MHTRFGSDHLSLRLVILSTAVLIFLAATPADAQTEPNPVAYEAEAMCGNDRGCDRQTACSQTSYQPGPPATYEYECRSRCYTATYQSCNCYYVHCYRVKYTNCGPGCWTVDVGSCMTGPSWTGPFCNGDDEGDDCATWSDSPNSSVTGTNGSTELATVSTECGNNSPIIIDLDGDGYALTDAAGGVAFDLNSDGTPEQLSWTTASVDDAFLAADRNGNGRIDNGRELFGNFTPQLRTPQPNGFLAMAIHDRVAEGGNGDGVIDARDGVYRFLLLWQDRNHNGLSEEAELQTLEAAGIRSIELDHKESKRTDVHGNAFRFRAKIDRKASDAARWAWDVFLVRQ